MDAKRALALVKKYGTVNEAARKEHLCRSTIQRAVKKSKATTDGESSPKKSLGEFRAMYDKSFIVPKRIKDALKALGDGWEYEIDFCKLAKVSLQDLGRVREQFADHLVCIGREGRRVWTGSRKVAEQMRQMV